MLAYYLRLVIPRSISSARDQRRGLGSMLDGVVQGDAPVWVGAVNVNASRYQLLHAENVASLARTKYAGTCYMPLL